MSVSLLFIEKLEQAWKRSPFSAIPVRMIVSFDGDSCVVRFHAIRAGEEWCSNDLDAFEEAMLIGYV